GPGLLQHWTTTLPFAGSSGGPDRGWPPSGISCDCQSGEAQQLWPAVNKGGGRNPQQQSDRGSRDGTGELPSLFDNGHGVDGTERTDRKPGRGRSERNAGTDQEPESG